MLTRYFLIYLNFHPYNLKEQSPKFPIFSSPPYNLRKQKLPKLPMDSSLNMSSLKRQREQSPIDISNKRPRGEQSPLEFSTHAFLYFQLYSLHEWNYDQFTKHCDDYAIFDHNTIHCVWVGLLGELSKQESFDTTIVEKLKSLPTTVSNSSFYSSSSLHYLQFEKAIPKIPECE